MFRRKPLKPYTYDLHDGTNTWNAQRRRSIFGGVPCFWVTCNGEKVDLRSAGFPRAYYLGYPTAFLDLARRAEDTSRRLQAILETVSNPTE